MIPDPHNCACWHRWITTVWTIWQSNLAESETYQLSTGYIMQEANKITSSAATSRVFLLHGKLHRYVLFILFLIIDALDKILLSSFNWSLQQITQLSHPPKSGLNFRNLKNFQARVSPFLSPFFLMFQNR